MAELEIVSGGQSGVDRAALDSALTWNLPVGGWCPAGRRAEDGPISRRYPMRETPTNNYLQRTRWNVRDSDGTLILGTESTSQGTAATLLAAITYGKPLMRAELDQVELAPSVAEWMRVHHIHKLNIAGPRESEAPGAYQHACRFLDALFARISQAGVE